MKKNSEKIFAPGQARLRSALEFASFLFTRPGLALLKRVAARWLRQSGIIKVQRPDYDAWIKKQTDAGTLKKDWEQLECLLARKPKISMVISVDGESIGYLPDTFHSIQSQFYSNCEVCLALPENHQWNIPPGAGKVQVKTVTAENRAAGCNTALAAAGGEYILFVQPGDALTQHCLSELVRHINAYPSDAVIYADDDIIAKPGYYAAPYFKPCWSPDSFLSRNYIGNNFLMKKDLALQLHGVRQGFNGCEWYDLLLRATEVTQYAGHVPKVLCHLRRRQLPDAATAMEAIRQALARRGTPAVVGQAEGFPGCYRINYELPEPGRVSIIIPTKDHAALLKTAIDSILHKTVYPDYEIIVLNNNSATPEFARLMSEYSAQYPGRFRCIDAFFPFNFARLANTGVAAANGQYILLFNNDLEAIHPDWLTQMTAYAQHPQTGAVGAKLLYPDGTIQHAGIVLGVNGDAAHIFARRPRETGGYFGCAATATNYSAVTGACLLCRKELYLAVAGMDERLAVEYNDLDLCLKLLQRGHYNVYLPVELYHHESATRGHPFRSRQAWRQHKHELTIFKARWQRFIDDDPYYNRELGRQGVD